MAKTASMSKREALRALEAMGTAQNRKVYPRHGVRPPLYGVSYTNLGKLRKSIGTDHALAEALFETGNHDARVLATMIADPGATKRSTLDAWLRACDNYVLTEAVAGLAARGPHAHRCMEKWLKGQSEWIVSAGWSVLAGRAMDDPALDDGALADRIGQIEAGIHTAKNRIRHAMNQALIAIGGRNAALRKKAVAAAKRIGRVDVDHGETGCKTPDAAAYIEKISAHRARKR